MRSRFPSEDEQTILYRQILKSLAPRPVVMRTLDIGGDKSCHIFLSAKTIFFRMARIAFNARSS